MKRITGWLVASVLSLSFAVAGVVPGRYIVELDGQPTLVGGRHMLRQERDRAIRNRAPAIAAQQSQMRSVLESHRAKVLNRIQNVANALVVQADPDSKAELEKIPGVKRVHPVYMRKLFLDRAVNVVHASDAWAAIGGSQFAGKGVRIAIIDTGIDTTHPAFQDPDLTMPSGFPQVNNANDRQYANSKVIVARNYDTTPGTTPLDTVGQHGTAVAMVAAGEANAGPHGVIMGIAPKAQLGDYKVFPDNQDGAPDDLIIEAIDDAVSDGMDVINLSLGSIITERPDQDLLIQAVERASASGVIVVTAAGNDGPGANTIGSPAASPSAITVGNSNNDRAFAGQAAVAGLGILLAVPSPPTVDGPVLTAPLVDVTKYDESGLACETLPAARPRRQDRADPPRDLPLRG